MAEESKEKLLEVEAVRQRIESLRTKVGEMADYIRIEERRARLAELEAEQAGADFWNNQAKAREVIAATNAERAYVAPYDSLLKAVEAGSNVALAVSTTSVYLFLLCLSIQSACFLSFSHLIKNLSK